MPNHVCSVVTAKLDVIRQLLNEDGEVDFNLVIPQPENIEHGDCGYPSYNVRSDCVHPETGKVCWYAWNPKNWGTKWNAYDQGWITGEGQQPMSSPPEDSNEPVTVKFETAWAIPEPVFVEWARRNRTEPIHIEFADEDLGSNVGILDYNLDRDVYFKDLDGTDEGRELACKLHLGQTWAQVQAERCWA